MVDLGFLLITFFIFTTSAAQPVAMKLNLPADGDSLQTAESKTLNLVLGARNRVFFYTGNAVGNAGCTDFSPYGLRSIVRQARERIARNFGDADQLVVLIRPTKESSYMNLVDILDEMVILGIKKYVLLEEPGPDIMSSLRPTPGC
jgi:biopolymer transport protein ExbD